MSHLEQVPPERPRVPTHINTEAPAVIMQIPSAPLCPNCSRPMVLSHKFYATPGGPQVWHFHCRVCKIGLSQAEKEQGSE
jgi:hypothetical protein